MIKLHNVSVTLGNKTVISDVSATVSTGLTGIVGPNGSGKSTLLNTIVNSITPRRGRVEIDGADVTTVPRRRLAHLVALVSQQLNIETHFTIAEYVSLGRLPYLGFGGILRAHDKEIVDEVMGQLGVSHLSATPLSALSGGELQRAHIAKALVQQPRYLLLDEPTNHLDIHFQHELMHIIRNLGTPTCVVLHDLNLANQYCEHIILLNEGEVIASGSPQDVFEPSILAPVYRVHVERLMGTAGSHLLFSRDSHPH